MAAKGSRRQRVMFSREVLMRHTPSIQILLLYICRQLLQAPQPAQTNPHPLLPVHR